eukprot:TRINITY_DN60244_c0_g1_i3.p1 TRINITY_DN60244_c0_g1~~TRINITY_DN60244_c0_g1_i3.p1  ORF type:complete len:700 (+),score=20.89 TRINITY_DN60244_c0_g1_i3:37-2100(+)
MSSSESEEAFDFYGGLDTPTKHPVAVPQLTEASSAASPPTAVFKSHRESLGPSTVVVVEGLPWWTTTEDLEGLMSKYGAIRYLRIYDNSLNALSLGIACVAFAKEDVAQAACENLNGTTWQQSKLSVSVNWGGGFELYRDVGTPPPVPAVTEMEQMMKSNNCEHGAGGDYPVGTTWYHETGTCPERPWKRSLVATHPVVQTIAKPLTRRTTPPPARPVVMDMDAAPPPPLPIPMVIPPAARPAVAPPIPPRPMLHDAPPQPLPLPMMTPAPHQGIGNMHAPAPPLPVTGDCEPPLPDVVPPQPFRPTAGDATVLVAGQEPARPRNDGPRPRSSTPLSGRSGSPSLRHKHSHRRRHSERDRDREREWERERDRPSRFHSHSSRDDHRHHRPSSRRERDDRHSHRERERDHRTDRDRDRDRRDREWDRDRDRERKHSSSSLRKHSSSHSYGHSHHSSHSHGHSHPHHSHRTHSPHAHHGRHRSPHRRHHTSKRKGHSESRSRSFSPGAWSTSSSGSNRRHKGHDRWARRTDSSRRRHDPATSSSRRRSEKSQQERELEQDPEAAQTDTVVCTDQEQPQDQQSETQPPSSPTEPQNTERTPSPTTAPLPPLEDKQEEGEGPTEPAQKKRRIVHHSRRERKETVAAELTTDNHNITLTGGDAPMEEDAPPTTGSGRDEVSDASLDSFSLSD